MKKIWYLIVREKVGTLEYTCETQPNASVSLLPLVPRTSVNTCTTYDNVMVGFLFWDKCSIESALSPEKLLV